MPNMTFANPQGQQITIDSPDGSTPSEQELDQLFSQSSQSKQPASDDSNAQEEPESIADIQSQQNKNTQSPTQNSTGNPITDIAGDVARGMLNSGAGTADKIDGVAKLLKGVTGYDIGIQGLKNVSDKLKQLASQQPQSSNPLVSGISQFAGGIPDAMAEFAGSGGPVGFIARSAALSAADAYNKSQTASSLIKGAAVGGTVGAVLNKIPDVLEGAGNILKKWGQTGGKTYIQAVTGATDKDAQEIIDKLQNDPTFDINPKNKVEDYNEAKDKSQSEISALSDNNKSLIQQQKEQNSKEYDLAKIKSDDAVNTLVENNRDTIDNLRTSQSQERESLSNSTSANMMAATDASTQRLASAVEQSTINSVKAKDALENTLVSTFDTANKKLDSMVKGVTTDVSNAHASLEKNNLDYVPTSIIKNEIDSNIGSGSGKFYTNTGTGKRTLNIGGQTIEVPEERISGINGQSIPSKIIPAEGTGTGAVNKSLDLINETRKGLVDEFKSGKTSLSSIEAHSMALESAIDKGFSGQSIPKGLVSVMARIKNSINPTKLYEKYPNELSHLKPLAEANRSYSTQIDGLRNALNLYKDNVDGNVNPQKVFKALDSNDSAYIAKLKQADESLPPQDRIFNKVKDAYDNYRKIEVSEKQALVKTQKNIAQQRQGLNKKFNEMKNKLASEHKEQLISKIKETRINKRNFTQQEGKDLENLHSRQKQALAIMQAQKDKELNTLQESVNDRLHNLHLLHMARGSRADARGNARIFQNVANYRSVDGLTTLNPAKMIQGSILSKIVSPMGASGIVKSALHAPKGMEGAKQLAGNKILKSLLATKLSGR